MREIGAQFGIRSTNGVKDHINSLQRKGVLTWQPMKARSARLTDKGRELLGMKREPTPLEAAALAYADAYSTQGASILDARDTLFSAVDVHRTRQS